MVFVFRGRGHHDIKFSLETPARAPIIPKSVVCYGINRWILDVRFSHSYGDEYVDLLKLNSVSLAQW